MQVRNNGLQEFDLTADEEVASHLLSAVQRAKLQNLRVMAMCQKFSAAPDHSIPGSVETYWQLEASLRGRVQLIDELLEADDLARAQTQPTPAN